jgi:multimeric flavodoxin WrbA
MHVHTTNEPPNNEPRRFLFVLASGRRGGNTEDLARRAAAALPPDAQQHWIRLEDHPLPAFADISRRDAPQPAPDGNELTLLEATLAATDLVIASPVYWYSLSSGAKLYLDHWSHWLRRREPRFREQMARKTLWAVSALAESDPSSAEPLVRSLELTARYLGAQWGGALLAVGSWPGDIRRDDDALRRADAFFAPAGAAVPA